VLVSRLRSRQPGGCNMPRKEDYFPSLRRNPRRERQIAVIGERIGAPGEFAAVIDYALARAAQGIAPVCEGCGKPLPLSTSPYFAGGASVYLCDECAEPEEEPQSGQ
jgi:hypothetical protein